MSSISSRMAKTASPFARANLWASAVAAVGGTVSAGRFSVVATFIAAEMASGAWWKTDDYWAFWAENATQALTSLKQRRLATAVNSPTFTADRHYLFDGATNYIDTGFIPGTHALTMSNVSNHVEIYERTNVSGNNYAIGSQSSASRFIGIRPRVTGNAFIQSSSAVATFTLPVATSQGLTQGGRFSSTLTDVYGAKNGVDMVRTTNPTSLGVGLPGASFCVGANNNGGTVASFRADSVGFASVGAALSSTQRLARYNAVQAWATSVGANV